MEPNVVWMLVAWLAVVGGAVGSFLNVVVYRLPLGLSIVRPPSHCPKCKIAIRWYDNVPVLGWITLGGRCRNCREPISARYPLVEAVTAGMFAAVGLAEIDRLGTAYPVHLLLLCTLLCAGLIEYDGNWLSVNNLRDWVRLQLLFAPVLIVATVEAFAWPELRIRLDWETSPVWFRAMVLVLPVIAVVPLLFVMWLRPNFRFGAFPWALLCIYIGADFRVAGAIMGSAALCYFMLLPLGRFWPKLRTLPTMLLWACTLAWILFAARLVSF